MARRDLRPSSASYISQILRPNVPIKQFTWLFTRLWTHRVEQHELYELAQHIQLRGNYLGIYRRQMPPWTNVSVTQHRFGHCHNPGRYESSIAWHLVCGVRCLVCGIRCLVFGVWCLVFGVWCLASQYIAAMELSFLYAAHATYGPMHQYVLTQNFFSLPILMSSPFRHNKGRQASD